MRKNVLIFIMTAVFLIGSLNIAVSQDQPLPKKDTVNIDTDAKPTFYYATDEVAVPPAGSSGSATIYALIAGIVIIAGGMYYLLKRKKK
jgi:LPXTG-motif cell wall-anchored protein